MAPGIGRARCVGERKLERGLERELEHELERELERAARRLLESEISAKLLGNVGAGAVFFEGR